MKSNLKRRILALMLCMVMVLSSATSVLADDANAGNTNNVEENQKINNEPAVISDEADSTEQTQNEPEKTPAETEANEENPQAQQPETTQPSEPAAETQKPSEQPAVTENTPVQEAMELKQDMKDADGNVNCTVTANISEGTFSGANTSDVTMEVTEVEIQTAEEIKGLIEKGLAEDKALGEYFLYKISFKVNGETIEPGREIKITFEKKNFKIDDVKKANIFYYNEANSVAGNTEAEINEIIQKSEKIEELQNAGQSTDNIEDYDLSEITLKEDGTADKIQTEGRRSTVYGCYIEEDKPEEATDEENTPAETEPAEEATPAEVVNFENDDVIITVSAEEEGIIPQNSKLQVVPILPDDKETKEQYKEVEEQLNKKAENEEYDIAGFLAYDISFVNEAGEEVEPNGNVKVTIDYKKEVLPDGVEEDENLDVTVMHLEEKKDGNVKEVVDMVADTTKEAAVETTETAKVKKAEFITDGFSAYSVTWLAASKTVTIENKILKDGTLTVNHTGGTPKSYVWYKSSKETGSYEVVDRVHYQGDVSNISSDGRQLYPAFDEGARKWYKVEITFGDGTEMTSNPIQVTYYDELQNGSFETPSNEENPQGKWKFEWKKTDYTGKGGIWQSTGEAQIAGQQNTNEIEIVNPKKSDYVMSNGGFMKGVNKDADHGEQFAEINAGSAGALYQDVLTVPGESLNWWLAHRARSEQQYTTEYDSMYLVIMPTETALTADSGNELKTQTQLKTYLNGLGAGNIIVDGQISSNDRKIEDKLVFSKNGVYIYKITSSDSAWHSVYKTNAYVASDSVTRFFFMSGATSNLDEKKNNTIGNFVDSVGFSQDLPPVNKNEFSIDIVKKFEGLDNAELTTVREKIQFKISAKDKTGKDLSDEEIKNLFGQTIINGNEMIQAVDGSLRYSLAKLPITGEYEVAITEMNTELSGYDMTSASIAKVVVGAGEPTITEGTSSITIKSLKGETTANVEFTNSYDRSETKKVNFTKVWDDADNKYGTRPSSLEVTLKASIVVEENGATVEKALDEYTQTATLSESNAWKTSWEVPVYYDYNDTKVKINYTVEEGEINSNYVYKSPTNGVAQQGSGEEYDDYSDFSDVKTKSESQPNLRNRMASVSSLSTAYSNGLTATSDGSDSGLGEPAHNKYIEYNEKTAEYTLNLDVTGAKGEAKGADILFVIDTSGSMGGNYSTLLSQLKTLLTKDNTGLIDRIFATEGNVNSVAYVSFAGKSETKVSSWYQTEGKEILKSSIKNLKATGGTNWTYAMQQASASLARKDNSDNEKVVIFLSDGKPTYGMNGNSQTGNGSTTYDSYYTQAANVVNNSKSLRSAKMYSVYLTKGTKDGMKTFSDKVDNSELIDGTSLSTALNDILNKVIPTYKNVVITDTLSENVVFAETNPTITVTKRTAAGVKTTLSAQDYNVSITNNNKVTVELLNGDSLEDGATYTVSFKVKPSEIANDKFSNGGYTDRGDAGTGSTSAGKDGFYSNKRAQTTVTYEVNDEKGSAAYPMPVVQVTMHELSYVKEWKQPANIENPTDDVILHVVYTDGTRNTIALSAANEYKYTEKVPVTKNISSITEESIDGYTASYQITDGGTNAIITNSYSKVTKNTIAVKKVWEGGTTRNPIEVSLWQSANDGTARCYDTQTLSDANGWEYTWKDLPLREGSVTGEIVYTYAVREENSPANYSSNIKYDYKENETIVTIKNIYDPNCADEDYHIVNVLQTENITLEKEWNDDNNALSKRPSSLGIKVSDGNAENDLTFYLNGVGDSWQKTVRLLKKAGVTYTAEELLDSASEFYELESMNTVVTNSGTTFSFVNKLKTTSIVVHKEWNDGGLEIRPESISFTLQYRKTADSTWEIYDTYNMTSENFENDEAWTMLIDNLPATWEYKVTETNVASGYNTNVTKSDNKYTITNTLNWKAIKTSTPIGSKEATPLSGAEFELKQGATVMATGISGTEGVIEWTLPTGSEVNLDELDGEYTIHETKAPNGYVISGDWTLVFEKGLLASAMLDGTSVAFSSDLTDGVVISLTNDAIYELPHTGGLGIYWYSIGGMLLMIAAALILYKNKCREVLES